MDHTRQVKTIITPRRVGAAVICVFTCLTSSAVPIYVVNRLEMKFSVYRNKSVLGLIYTDNRELVERVSFAVNQVLVPFSAFFIITVSTTTLVIKLHESTKWREKSVTSSQAIVSNRNQKVAKMVVMISGLFIICFIPVSIIFIAVCVVPELSFYGKYRNMLTIIGGFGFLLESVNSAVNIFIYYSMSSKYRFIFHQMFGITNGKGSNLADT